MKELGIFECESGLKLVIRNGQEIFIPQMARKEMILELHSTHMSTEGMKKLARKKFWWPQMSKDLESVYEACGACKENSRSKNNVSGKGWRWFPQQWSWEAQGNCFVWTLVNTADPIFSSLRIASLDS